MKTAYLCPQCLATYHDYAEAYADGLDCCARHSIEVEASTIKRDKYGRPVDVQAVARGLFRQAKR
jgi:hypothetical protein